jgi:hypothetical protein
LNMEILPINTLSSNYLPSLIIFQHIQLTTFYPFNVPLRLHTTSNTLQHWEVDEQLRYTPMPSTYAGASQPLSARKTERTRDG